MNHENERTYQPQKPQRCRRLSVLDKLNSVVNEIEGYEKEVIKEPKVIKKKEQCICNHPKIGMDEYYYPVTLGGHPARPVLTRAGGPPKEVWCPPCDYPKPVSHPNNGCYKAQTQGSPESPWIKQPRQFTGCNEIQQKSNGNYAHHPNGYHDHASEDIRVKMNMSRYLENENAWRKQREKPYEEYTNHCMGNVRGQENTNPQLQSYEYKQQDNKFVSSKRPEDRRWWECQKEVGREDKPDNKRENKHNYLNRVQATNPYQDISTTYPEKDSYQPLNNSHEFIHGTNMREMCCGGNGGTREHFGNNKDQPGEMFGYSNKGAFHPKQPHPGPMQDSIQYSGCQKEVGRGDKPDNKRENKHNYLNRMQATNPYQDISTTYPEKDSYQPINNSHEFIHGTNMMERCCGGNAGTRAHFGNNKEQPGEMFGYSNKGAFHPQKPHPGPMQDSIQYPECQQPYGDSGRCSGCPSECYGRQNKRPSGNSMRMFDGNIGEEQKVGDYLTRLAKDYRDVADWDVYGGQKCNHVHPPEDYFKYKCPDNDIKHRHWSPPFTTECRYPNTCVASCFDHPVFKDWNQPEPSYRHYLQRKGYVPF